MNLSLFYREQEAEQGRTAATASLQNARDRATRAATAWANLAARSERADHDRAHAADLKLMTAMNENPDRGAA